MLQGKASQALCTSNAECFSMLAWASCTSHAPPAGVYGTNVVCGAYVSHPARPSMLQHACDALQDMGHRLDEAAPVQRRKHWEELADNVVSSAYCGESPGVEADSLREPAATSKVT